MQVREFQPAADPALLALPYELLKRDEERERERVHEDDLVTKKY